MSYSTASASTAPGLHALNLASCTSLKTVKLRASLLEQKRCTIVPLINTIPTLPATAHDIHIIIDTFRRESWEPYGSTQELWPVAWERLGRKRSVKAITIHFSDSGRTFSTGRGDDVEDYKVIAQLLRSAKEELNRLQFEGGTYSVYDGGEEATLTRMLSF